MIYLGSNHIEIGFFLYCATWSWLGHGNYVHNRVKFHKWSNMLCFHLDSVFFRWWEMTWFLAFFECYYYHTFERQWVLYINGDWNEISDFSTFKFLKKLQSYKLSKNSPSFKKDLVNFNLWQENTMK